MNDFHEYEGINLTPELREKEYDMVCPMMTSSLEDGPLKKNNYYKVMCESRQRDRSQRYCFPHCQATEKMEKEGHKKKDTQMC